MAAPNRIQQPMDTRRRVIGFGMALAFISYLDRACISQAAPMIARDLHFNAIQMGYIFSAFGLTYAAMEIPSGWLIDRYGPRMVLTRVATVAEISKLARPLTIFVMHASDMLTDYLPHGDGLIAWNFIRGLAMRGHEIHVAVTRVEPPDPRRDARSR